MKVLVTGASGFLGAWIIKRLLARGFSVRAFDLNTDTRVVQSIVGDAAQALEWQAGDITNAEQVEQAVHGCDSIIHLAGILASACAVRPVLGAQVNLIGTLNVFEAAIKLGITKVLYASSASVFGPDDGETPFPTTHYGAFKLAGEGVARAYWRDHGISSIGLRPLIIYGPERGPGLSSGPSLACRAAAYGEPCEITFTGVTGLVYVDDVAAAYEAALDIPFEGAETFVMGGEVASVDDVMAIIREQIPTAQLSASGVPLPFPNRFADDGLDRVLPGLSRTSLRDGLGQTLAFYQQQQR
jgi:nucleoside-diphosphate-sugar epimerase